MNGVVISFDESRTYIELTLKPAEFASEVSMSDIIDELSSGETKRLYISEKSLKSACDTANHYFKTGDDTEVNERIGERKTQRLNFESQKMPCKRTLYLPRPTAAKCLHLMPSNY